MHRSLSLKIIRTVVAVLTGTVALSGAGTVPASPQAAPGVVQDGHARFQVLTPTLIRLEYAGDDRFQDQATFTAVGRSFPAPGFTTTVTGGVREIRTAGLTLRYRQNSGPFTRDNTSVQLTTTNVTAAPLFPSYCAFATACEAENGVPGGSAATAYDHAGRTGSGFLAGFESTGAALTQDVSAVPSAGQYRLALRYANAQGGDGQTTTRTLSTTVNGAPGPRFSLPATASWDTWATASVTVPLNAGTNSVRIERKAGDSGNVNLDSLAVTTTTTAGYPAADTSLLTTAYGAGPRNVLGGWDRSLDNPEAVPTPEHPGLLDRDGWYLLDDTRSALLNADRTVTDRPSHGAQPYQDGYFFGYGKDFKQGLADLNALTGGTALLPRSAYGVWFSRYFAYSDNDYRTALLPKFRSTFTPIDWLVVDTDWKSPSQWNGWNWNTALFPDPQGFLNWTKQQGLAVSLNVHTSIAGNDPRFAAANATAGGLIPDGGNSVWDWSNPAHLRSYFDLHRPFDAQGVRTWWLDYCSGCGRSTASDPGVAPDNFINQAYADHAAAQGLRGFSFGRIGGAEQGGIHSSYPLGPWSERRNTLQFTGDTPMSWDMLAYEAHFTPDEAAAGLSNVSHDIGSFHGGHLPDDLYARWLQLGTFQPVDRLHSDHGDRLPWEYPGAAGESASKFLRLREALVPYTYTLAKQANQTGVPITRPLYLNYPDQEAAYTNPQEYLYGDNVLVAPITSAGGSVTAWIPPGTWTDYFTGTVYTGPSTATITKPLSEMPVLVKAGGVVPVRTNYVDNAAAPLDQLTLNVTAGADGNFPLYEDAGEGTGASSTTRVGWQDAAKTLTVDAASGTAPARAYTLRLANSAAPTAVSVDGQRLPETAWSYNSHSRTVTVTTASLPSNTRHTVTLSGTAADNPAAGQVTGRGGLCLAVHSGQTADGTPLELAACDHTPGQQFTPPGAGAVRVLGKCLDVAGGGSAAGTPVQLYTCNGTAAQSWTLTSAGTLVNAGRCLAATAAGDGLRLADCAGSPDQAWRFPPAALTGPAGLCADVDGASPASGTAVQLYGCNGTDAQRWSAPGDTSLRTLGKCLDVTGAGTANATPVQLWDCNGSAAQQWVSGTGATLRNVGSGRCLDDPDNAGKPGDRLRVYDCNTTAAQRFTLGS